MEFIVHCPLSLVVMVMKLINSVRFCPTQITSFQKLGIVNTFDRRADISDACALEQEKDRGSITRNG